MAWTSLSSRISNFPLIIAGPILRRVESDSVSVWIVCKQAISDMTLQVNGSDTSLTSSPTNTIQLGEHLHVALLTAMGAPELVPGIVYTYDINFADGRSLSSSGILNSTGSTVGAIEKISYGDTGFPSFIMPGETIDELRIVHGSCRKPHGGKADALEALHVILESTYDNPSQRPQQLFLTGDQIYADDVADVLLFMLTDAASALLGWDEEMIPPWHDAWPSVRFGPHQRADIVKSGGSAGLSVDESVAKSHLLFLGEFYAMYLFVWSPELWPSALPSFDEVFVESEHEGDDLTPKASHFRQDTLTVEQFRSSLANVRKALANIPIFMMFDDHEVTDDLFLHKRWCENALTNPLGKRIIQNGFSAVAVFQAWGNTPGRFETGHPGKNVLDKLVNINNDHTLDTPWEELGNLLLPQPPRAIGNRFRLEGGFPWDYKIAFTAYWLVVLDTRSHRAFYDEEGPPVLIDIDDMDRQLGQSNGSRVTILLSPSPITGHTVQEELVKPLGRIVTSSEYADFEDWASNRWGFESIMQRIVSAGHQQVVILSGDPHYSFTNKIEYWDDRSNSEERRACMIQLCSSGFKNSTRGTNAMAGSVGIPIIGLLIGSALEPRLITERIGWLPPGRHYIRLFESDPFSGTTSSYRFRTSLPNQPGIYLYQLEPEGRIPKSVHLISGDNPDWQYRITFSRDVRPSTERGSAIPGSSGDRQSLATVHKSRFDYDAQRIAVGHDNLGYITFNREKGKLVLWHELWYLPHDETDEDFSPYTVHSAKLISPEENHKPIGIG